MRHFGEIAEAADDGFQVIDFTEHDAGGLAEDFVELGGILFAGALQIFDRGLQREQRVFEFMREAAGQFAPGGDAFDLHEFFALLDQLAGHLIKGFGELGDFVAAVHIDAGAPITVGDFARGGHEFLHRAGDAGGAPPAEQQAEQEADGGDAERQPADAAFERDDGALGTADEQNADQFFLAADERERVKNFGVRGIEAPADFFGLLDGIGFNFFDQGRKRSASGAGPLLSMRFGS